MKKILLATALLSLLAKNSDAQINKGGLPISLVSTEQALFSLPVSQSIYQAPTLEKVIKDDAIAQKANPNPDRGGIFIPTDISFPESGTFVSLADGKTIWRAAFQVTNAPAIGLYYDKFNLPEGVNYFITNANRKQVLGAYTSENNTPDGFFATQMLEGNTAVLELDIDQSVNIAAIALHINRVAYMYRGYENLKAQYADDADNSISAKPTDQFMGGSATCEINATCPQGTNFAISRKAVARIVMDEGNGFVGFCSATLINNTNQDCTPYMLTASHCDPDNNKSNSDFSQWIFYFNYETPLCNGSGNVKETNTMSGANFVARADYDNTSNSLIGDFLLLKLRSKVPDSYGAYLAGWNKNSVLSPVTSFIGFHHPSGDVKKLSVGTGILPTGRFNQNTTPNTHWLIDFSTGGVEGGSSGSALFDEKGFVVGDLSGSPPVNVCTSDSRPDIEMSNADVVYSKLSRNWEYPEGNGAANAQLKPWLDPAGTNPSTLIAKIATVACAKIPTTGISNTAASALGNAISIYPNPVTTGVVKMKANLAKQADISVTIYDITGATKATYNLPKVSNEVFTFDLSGYSNGTYLMKISNGVDATSKKIMLMR